ncbi:MAG: type II secretion system GspH family protein [Candidatus Gastranaerophilales bacterium]|nr:type II secretion system GspH family protein [Candidatus Gastranaerophilales bacterium]
MRKNAFSLAEVLITLGIIGVVAAMTIPNLLQNNFEKRAINQLRETQSIISQAVRMSEEEYGDVEGWGLKQDNDSAIKIANNLKPFLKIASDCGLIDRDTKCIGKNYQYLNTNSTVDYRNESYKYKMSLLNGSSLMVQAIGNTGGLQFNVDINGTSKPNVMGKDLFLFQYYEKGLYPMGAPKTIYDYKNTCQMTSTGSGCAYYVLNFQNMNYLRKK